MAEGRGSSGMMNASAGTSPAPLHGREATPRRKCGLRERFEQMIDTLLAER
jgi:hypothetical protein